MGGWEQAQSPIIERGNEMKKHPRPLVQGNSGAIYCTGCLVSAATVVELDARPCYAEMMED